MKHVRVYGGKRTGTNFLRELCIINLVDTKVYGGGFDWKHDVPKVHSRIKKNWSEIHPLIIIKNPYSWWLSIQNWPKKENDIHETVAGYNALYNRYKEFHLDKQKVWATSGIVRYEDLLETTEEVLQGIADFIGTTLKDEFIIPNKVTDSDVFTKERKEFYLGGHSNETIADEIDWDIMGYYGYKR